MGAGTGRAAPRPLELPAAPRHPLADSEAATAWANSARCAGAELDLAAAPVATGSRTHRVRPLAGQYASPPRLSRVSTVPYTPRWRSCGLAAPPAQPRPRPLALLSLRPSPRSSPRDCTPSTESAAAFTLTSRTPSRLPLSSSTGMLRAAGRTVAGREGLERRGRSNLREGEEV